MNLEAGYFYHIFNRGNNLQTVFYTRENYLFFLKKMKEYLTPYASIVSWCLMPNHFHWVIFVRKEKIELNQSGQGQGHALTSRQGMTKIDKLPVVSKNEQKKGTSHTLAASESMTAHMNTCIIGIGSNIEAEVNIPKALKILEQQLNVLQVSAFIKTKPIGIENQPDFTNGAVKVETDLNQLELNKFLKSIEDRIGRDRTKPKFSSRCIDLDIVVWNGKIVDEDYYTRDFIRESVREIN